MTQRRLIRNVRAESALEGAGVGALRTIGSPALRHLDSFLLLDYISSSQPDDYIAGFPDHQGNWLARK